MQVLKTRFNEDGEFRLKTIQFSLIVLDLILFLSFQSVDLFIILLLISNMILSVGIILTYSPKHSISFFSHFPIFINYFLSFSFIIILPIDIAVTNHKRVLGQQNYKPQICIKVEYLQIIMFVIMINNKFIIKFGRIYLEQGHICIFKNIKATLKICAKVFILIIIVSLTTFIVLSISGQNESNVYQNIIATFQVIGNVYGMLVLTVLLGYSLFKFPYSLWKAANYKQNLTQLILGLPQLNEQYQSIRMEYQNQVLYFYNFIKRVPVYGTDVSKCRNILNQQLDNQLEYLNIDLKYLDSLQQTEIEDSIDLDSMAKIRSKMNCLNHNYYCKQAQLEDSYNKTLQISNIKEIGENVKQNKPNEQRLILKIDCLQISLTKIILYKSFSIICFILSSIILYSEIVLIFQSNDILIF